MISYTKNFKESFENERKIERRSFVTEREREHKTAKKLSASKSGAKKLRLSASANNFFERTKALAIMKIILDHMYPFQLHITVSVCEWPL